MQTKKEQEIEAIESILCKLKLAHVPNTEADSLCIMSSIMYRKLKMDCKNLLHPIKDLGQVEFQVNKNDFRRSTFPTLNV